MCLFTVETIYCLSCSHTLRFMGSLHGTLLVVLYVKICLSQGPIQSCVTVSHVILTLFALWWAFNTCSLFYCMSRFAFLRYVYNLTLLSPEMTNAPLLFFALSMRSWRFLLTPLPVMTWLYTGIYFSSLHFYCNR